MPNHNRLEKMYTGVGLWLNAAVAATGSALAVFAYFSVTSVVSTALLVGAAAILGGTVGYTITDQIPKEKD